MSTAVNFLSDISKRFCRSIYTWKQKEIYAPLLSPKEILDLSYRADFLDKNSQHPHEVGHRQYGDIRSIYRGFGMDYEESRAYQHGDDFRFMNWRHSARTGKLYMKVFREERQPSVFILMDKRANMRFGTQSRLKVTQAARIASLLAFNAQNHNTAIGGVLLEKKLTWIPELHNNTGALDFINAANTACPPLHDNITEPSTLEVIRLLQNMLVQGSIIYLISDFHDIDKESRPILLQLACRYRVFAIRVSDAAELHLPDAGKLEFVMQQTTHRIDTSNEQIRHHYNKQAKEKRQEQMQIFSGAGINCIDIYSNENAIEKYIAIT